MFKPTRDQESQKKSKLDQNIQSCNINAGTIIEGKITSTENINLEGSIIGDVDCSKQLYIGDSGSIVGNTKAANMEAKGKITGDVKVTEIIHLFGDAFVKGTIYARQLLVEEGARYDGECKIG